MEKENPNSEKEKNKKTETAEASKEEKKEKPKIKASEKKEAIVHGKDLPISKKHAVAVCNFIRGKKIEEAIAMLEEVVRMKRAVPMKGEIPHRKGMERGRYPLKASKNFIKLLKQLAANASVKEIDLEKGKIECKADRASRPYKRFGQSRFKRTHVTLKLAISKLKRPKLKKKFNKKH